jgi:hypothetical protein
MTKQVKRRKANKILYIVRWASEYREGWDFRVFDDEMEAQNQLEEMKNGRIIKVKVIDEWVNVQPRKGSILR